MRTHTTSMLLLALTLAAVACVPAPDETDPSTAIPIRAAPAAPTTYYIRPDGGDYAQCTGLADAPYPGTGTDQACAWDHPFRALPPEGPPRIASGDTLAIGLGSYQMGFGAPGADVCETDYPWDCHMPPLPGGPDPDHPTRLLGAGWDTGCTEPPELWGTERALTVLDLTGSNHVVVACLEITDHAGCAEDHTGGLACERQRYPYGPWADTGIYAQDAIDVTLRDLDIHGLASAGIRAGRIADWTVEDVRIAANGWVGWEGDIDGDDAYAGSLTFRRWTVEWNGCVETYPAEQPAGCWGQTAGGYGDGVGTGETGGHWLIEDSVFLNNASDGLDLLYTRVPGSSITIRRTVAHGNAGNQIKTNGPTHIENVLLVGDCAAFEGKPYTHHVDACRAYGNALSVSLRPGDSATVTNATITGQGDCLAEAICEGRCTGAESVRIRNTIFRGQTDYLSPSERTCLIYHEGFAADPLDLDHNIIHHVKDDPCPVNTHDICGSPGLVDDAIDTFDPHLLAVSPAIDAGLPDSAPPDDLDGRPRVGTPDLGAYEWHEPVARVYVPVVVLAH